MSRLAAIFVVALSLAGFSGDVALARVGVDLELALAVDVSGSIDAQEARLQREGYIAAFRHRDVIRAIEGGILGRIAVAYYEWAGYGHHKIIADWTQIEGAKTALAFAAKLTEEPPQTASRTAIGSAIAFAVPYFDRNDFVGTRRVVDVSGDGPNNWGLAAPLGRDIAVAAGITVNGLPIVNQRPGPSGWPTMPNLDLYYRDCVIGGPGAFLVVANSFEDFAIAIRRKLILEIAGISPPDRRPGGVRPVSVHRSMTQRLAPPCTAGERRWRGREDF